MAGRLQHLQALRTIVLISGGLPFEQDSLTHFTELQRNVAKSGVVVYAEQLAQADTDASNQRGAGTETYAGRPQLRHAFVQPPRSRNSEKSDPCPSTQAGAMSRTHVRKADGCGCVRGVDAQKEAVCRW